MNHPALHRKAFLWLLILVSILFAWILVPFYGAVFWGIVLAILFAPFYRRLLHAMRMRRNLAAITTLLLSLLLVILPLVLISVSLAHEADVLYQKLKTGELDLGTNFHHVILAMPSWMADLLNRLGLADLATIQQKLMAGIGQTGKFVAVKAVAIGQLTFGFLVNVTLMLYLLYFLLRDGDQLALRIKRAIPLSYEHKQQIFSKFATVIRATVKGNIAVAAAQGAMGGLIFWYLDIPGPVLWAVVMAFLSLVPAIGAALIWGPVAAFLLLTGEISNGLILLAFGVLVIGLVDNILRPILVGKDTQMPDYVVLISTVGGIALFGLNGFVIGPVIAALFIAAWEMFSAEKESAVEPTPVKPEGADAPLANE